MTKVIHSDFLTVEGAMTSAFSTIENNQAWDLMPSLVPELTLCNLGFIWNNTFYYFTGTYWFTPKRRKDHHRL